MVTNMLTLFLQIYDLPVSTTVANREEDKHTM